MQSLAAGRPYGSPQGGRPAPRCGLYTSVINIGKLTVGIYKAPQELRDKPVTQPFRVDFGKRGGRERCHQVTNDPDFDRVPGLRKENWLE